MSGSSVRMYRTTLRTNSAPPKLVVVEAAHGDRVELEGDAFRPMSAQHLHCYQVASSPFWPLARRKVNLPSNAKRIAARSIRLP